MEPIGSNKVSAREREHSSFVSEGTAAVSLDIENAGLPVSAKCHRCSRTETNSAPIGNAEDLNLDLARGVALLIECLDKG